MGNTHIETISGSTKVENLVIPHIFSLSHYRQHILQQLVVVPKLKIERPIALSKMAFFAQNVAILFRGWGL